MPYHPDLNVDQNLHLATAGCRFYVVKRGFKKGTFTNPVTARLQTERFSNALAISVDCFEDAEAEWAANCLKTHGDALCPVAEAERVMQLRAQVAHPASPFSRNPTIPPAPIPLFPEDLHHSIFNDDERKFVAKAYARTPAAAPAPFAATSASASPAFAGDGHSGPAMRTPAFDGAGDQSSNKAFKSSPTKGARVAAAGLSGAAAFAQMGDAAPVDVHWGIEGIHRIFATRGELREFDPFPSSAGAVETAAKLGIPSSKVVGDVDPEIVAKWVKCE
ncbi:hypothetical protein B0H11DRAFT_1935083 [Mycena galericulata]|nr:hypothetical protein B0H11DRAFT_1935083 [Mycena galericulata]